MKKNIRISVCLFVITIIGLIDSNLKAQPNQSVSVYSSYFGGSNSEWGSSIAVDSLGYVYLAGNSFSTDLPVKSAIQSQNAGSSDAFVVKLSPDMKEIIFCTYLGGTDYDGIMDIALDKSGNLYAIGFTGSSNFPYTKNAYDTVHNGDYDLFFMKMDTQGKLLYSTYFGGSAKEQPRGLILDDSLNIYLTGFTNSRNFPIKSAYSGNYNGGNGGDYGFGGDAFIVKFNMKYDTLVFSTYLGGLNDELGYGIAVDKEYNVYITGETSSSNFPVQNGFKTIYGGNTDGFITKLKNTGKEIIYSSYFGGINMDVLGAVAINDKNEAYIIGGTKSSNLPCSENAFYKQLIGGEDVVIGKVNASGNALGYLSYFGGSKTDFGKWGCPKLHLIDSSTIILVSNSLSTNLPVTVNAFDNNFSGGSDYGDLFISKLNIDKKENLYTSYFGGSAEEGAHLGLVCLNDSTIYLGSWTSSTNLYTSLNALFSNFRGGGADACIMKVALPNTLITSIKQSFLQKGTEIFPNPTSGLVTLSFEKTSPQKAITEIYNTQGNLIFSQTINYTPKVTLDLSDFPDGMYAVKVIADGKVYNQKVLKK